MTIPSHVIGMLERIRARFQAEPLAERMLPSDAEFTTLRPVRKATRPRSTAIGRGCRARPDADKAAIADAATMADPAATAPISRISSAR
jgi:hydroxymethylglutaryl-CoA reductase (NADPH)